MVLAMLKQFRSCGYDQGSMFWVVGSKALKFRQRDDVECRPGAAVQSMGITVINVKIGKCADVRIGLAGVIW